jgi:signal transduction histidine kinase/streptogramin lyase
VRAGVAARYTKGAGIAGIVGAVLPDQEGNTWVGTYAGLCRFADGQFVAEGGYLGASYRVFCLFQDREHNVWVGSEEGLVRLTPRHFTTYTMQEGLTQDAIASVCAGRDGSVWIAVWGGGVNHFVDGHFAVIGRSNGLSSDFVLALDAARDGSLWVGADYGFGLNHIQGGQITHYGRAEGLTDPVLTALLEDEAGNMWIGSRSALNCLRGGTFNRYTMRQGLSNNKINALCVGQRGVVWIGTEDGLTQWTNGQFIVVSATEPLLRKTILSLYEDPEGTLWVGTRGAGVVRLRAGKADSFTTRDGLLSDSIYAILEDDRKNLWFNSSKGIFCVRKTELQEFARDGVSSLACVAYGKMDGIASSGQYQEVAQPAACKARDGRLWFRTTHGVAVVDPNITVNKLPPLVAIEQVLADRQDVALDKSQAAGRIGQLARPAPLVTIPPGRGDLEIHYTALSLRAPERNLFKYKLDRVDSAWVDAGGRRVAYYNNLAHGEYRFRVIACNNDGVWNEAGAAMVLILQPHYWQTWWFLGLCSLTAAAALAGSVRYATRRKLQRKLKWLEQQHAVETERMRIARDLHDNLGTRLTEILMLNEVSGSLSNNQEPTLKPSSRRISSLVRELVENLDAIVWSVNPKNDSLDNFVLYVYEYIDRVANVSPVPILRDIPATLPDCPLSSEQRHNLFLVIKEALNNVFRHSGATEVWFRLRVEDSTLALSLEDNGNGFAPGTASELGNGLVNMEKRMELIGGTFVVSSAPGAGTRIQLQVPLSNLAESKVRNPGSETHAA